MKKRHRKKREKAMMSREKTVGYGWVGRWADGKVGWGIPNCVPSHGVSELVKGRVANILETEKLWYCKITVEVVRAEDGREITAHYVPGMGLSRK